MVFTNVTKSQVASDRSAQCGWLGHSFQSIPTGACLDKRKLTKPDYCFHLCYSVRVSGVLFLSRSHSIILTSFSFTSNAEGGVGLICACLPVLNVLIAHYRKEYSSQKYYQQGSEVPLGDRKVGTGSKSGNFGPNFGDQSHLISYAGAPEGNDSIFMESGIRKTVAVEQTIETADSADGVDSDNRSRHS